MNTPPRPSGSGPSGKLRAPMLTLTPLLLALGGLAAAQDQSQTQATHVVTLGDLHSGFNRQVWWMSIPVIIVAILIFVGVSYALFHTVAKYREDRHTNEPEQFHGNNRLESILIAVPVVIVTLISVITVRTMALTNPTPPNALKINVTGAQFWWAFDYPGTTAVGGGPVTNGNELVVPTGRSIALTITAKDVIHAFWAPNLGGQRDAIPGSKKTWQIDTEQPGVYQGNCSVLCGASHANMRFKVVALPPEQYNTFIQAAQAYRAPTPATGSSEERGYTIFMQGKASAQAAPCASCHRIQGTPAKGAVGPDLSYFGSRNTLGAGRWEGEQARAMLKPWIINSAAVKPGALMPPYPNLSEQDLSDLQAYLESLKLPDAAAYWGKVPVR
ncbi:cytochrome c oxidase subunit II [Deinococcus sonorensis KR-87]|uniref:Cytochrome c oxidase subunit 2 n=1 Tax=Deinococcus sonorensis KR-87 TaxID=694439 RepID=A0AAU7U8I2_9DEIO